MLIKLKAARLLVTGGAGFMGSCFIRHLLGSSEFQGKIINLDLLTYAGNLDNLSGYEFDPRYTFVQGDVQDSELLERIATEHRIDMIVHFAAQTHVDNRMRKPTQWLL